MVSISMIDKQIEGRFGDDRIRETPTTKRA